MKRTTTIVVATIAIAAMSWIGIKEYRAKVAQRRRASDCEHRNVEFTGEPAVDYIYWDCV